VVGLTVFVYGTLRPGSWNHDRSLAPWLAAPCRPAALPGHALHHLEGLPYVCAEPGARVDGDVAELSGAAALAALDRLEDVDGGHYARVELPLDDGTPAWVWVAGARVAARLGSATRVAHGDWLLV